MTPQRHGHERADSAAGTPSINLAALIRREQDTGSSYADIAKRCGLSKAKIGQLADPDSRYQVRPDTVEKLARGLRLPVNVVRRAAMVTAGIADNTDPRAGRMELIVHHLEQLDDETLGMVEAMIETAVRRRG